MCDNGDGDAAEDSVQIWDHAAEGSALGLEALDDSDLFARRARGGTGAEDELLRRYSRLVRSITRTYSLSGLDRDDLMQEGMIGLLKAVRQYDPTKGVPFPAFAALVVKRSLLNVKDIQTGRQNAPLSSYVPLDDSFDSVSFQFDPEILAINKDEFSSLLVDLESRLSSFERKALGLFLAGFSITEIAEKLGREPKSTDNAITRVKKKAQAVRRQDGWSAD